MPSGRVAWTAHPGRDSVWQVTFMTQPASETRGKLTVTVSVHGLLQAAVRHPDESLQVVLAAGADVLTLIEALSVRTPLFDPRATIAVVEGVKVPLDRKLCDGELVQLYPIFGGG